MAAKIKTIKNAIETAKECLSKNSSFILQGGAGSGKTESLKILLQYMSMNFPDKTIACITHTNLAVQEIVNRVGTNFEVSTIHSFIYNLISNYKKNMKDCIHELFVVDEIVRENIKHTGMSEKEYNKYEHDKYKKIYQKYSDKVFSIKNFNCPRVCGKREYDRNPIELNNNLNEEIKELNDFIVNEIEKREYALVGYNNTSFDSYRDLTFGHDGLIKLFLIMFNRYPMLRNILRNKYDYIFIDEYQDTNEQVISDLVNLSHNNDDFSIALFGDAMQAIYENDTKYVEQLISYGILKEIPKEDNYRCSQQVIDYINDLRCDGLEQEVALKKISNGELESIESRKGSFNYYYSFFDEYSNYKDPDIEKTKDPKIKAELREQQNRLRYEAKQKNYNKIDSMIEDIKLEFPDSKILMLTNKAVAGKVGFENLYNIFNKRYIDVKDSIEIVMGKILLFDLYKICNLYNNKKYNEVINILNQNGFILKRASDKVLVKETIERILREDKFLWQTIQLALSKKIIKSNETFDNYIENKNKFLSSMNDDDNYLNFERLYNEGCNTYTRIQNTSKECIELESENEFKEFERKLKKKEFYNSIFGEEIKFSEVYKYFDYLDENAEYITMHKTKGSGINSVIVVIDEYGWYDYNFDRFRKCDFNNVKSDRRLYSSQKLMYVACSRAISNLNCVMLINKEDAEANKAMKGKCFKEL